MRPGYCKVEHPLVERSDWETETQVSTYLQCGAELQPISSRAVIRRQVMQPQQETFGISSVGSRRRVAELRGRYSTIEQKSQFLVIIHIFNFRLKTGWSVQTAK